MAKAGDVLEMEPLGVRLEVLSGSMTVKMHGREHLIGEGESIEVQRGLARLVLALAGPRRPYLFVDQWDVAAPPEAVFDAIATHVRFDWQVHADRRLLRVLTPVLRPLFRWNHNWAIARAMEGLEP